MLMSRAEAERRGLPIMASLRSFAAVGVHPSVMGIGPVRAGWFTLLGDGESATDVVHRAGEPPGGYVGSAGSTCLGPHFLGRTCRQGPPTLRRPL